MKKIAIMQPYLFPYIGYWQLLSSADTFVLYDDVTYIKNGWINRNNILLNSKPYMFTLPLLKSSSFSLINEIQVTDNKKVKEKIIKTIEHAYKKAPYYGDVFRNVQDILMLEGSISSVIFQSILWLKSYLNLDTEIIISSSLEKNNELKGQDKVIDIVKRLDGNKYINSIGGQTLYSKEIFKSSGIELNFIKTNYIGYKQFDNAFVPNLSIIDILMFNPPEKIKEFLNNYTLI